MTLLVLSNTFQLHSTYTLSASHSRSALAFHLQSTAKRQQDRLDILSMCSTLQQHLAKVQRCRMQEAIIRRRYSEQILGASTNGGRADPMDARDLPVTTSLNSSWLSSVPESCRVSPESCSVSAHSRQAWPAPGGLPCPAHHPSLVQGHALFCRVQAIDFEAQRMHCASSTCVERCRLIYAPQCRCSHRAPFPLSWMCHICTITRLLA